MARAACGAIQLFIGQHIAVVVNPRPHAVQPKRDIYHHIKGLQGGVNPILRGNPADFRRIHRRAPTPCAGLFQQQHTVSGLPGLKCGGQPGDATADHQHINMCMKMLVNIGVPVLGCLPQTGRFADERLVDMFPETARMDEHFVIKTGGQEPRQPGVDGAHVKFQARPVVLRPCGHTIRQRRRGDPLVGFKMAADP